MMLGSFYFKQKAKAAMKGNWQTALLVTFLAGVLMTAGEVYQAMAMPIYLYADGSQPMIYMQDVSAGTWAVFCVISVLTLLVSPVLNEGCCHYFVERLRGTELGLAGLASRLNLYGKALWLHVRMGVQIFLWGLLLVVPGVIAAIRYSMAPYYLAEHPEMTVSEALEASKTVMKTLKTTYFSLMLSFVGWMFLTYALQMMLVSVSGIVSTMAGLFMQLWISTYTNAAVASFYLTVSAENGVTRAQREIGDQMRDMGIDPARWSGQDGSSNRNGDDDDLLDGDDANVSDGTADGDDTNDGNDGDDDADDGGGAH